MNPLEEVAPEDLGRTSAEEVRRSRWWCSPGRTNFLIAFLMFWGIFVANGVNEVVPQVNVVIEESPAAAAGLEPGDEIVAVNGEPVDGWEDVTAALSEAGPGPATITVEHNGATLGAGA